MINSILTEIFVELSFIFALIISGYDKIELFQNYDSRNLIGYLILFSLLGLFNKLSLYFLGSLVFALIIIVYNTLMFLGELIYMCYKVIKYFLKKKNKEN